MYFKIVMNIGTFQERKKNWDKMQRMWARTSSTTTIGATYEKGSWECA